MYSCIFYATLRHKRCTAISTCTTSCSTKETRLSEKSSSFICSSSNFNIFTLFIIIAWPKEHRTHRKRERECEKKNNDNTKEWKKIHDVDYDELEKQKKLMQTVFIKPFELYRDKSNSQQPTTDNNNNGKKTRMFWVWNV